jgi:hypothetical protein
VVARTIVEHLQQANWVIERGPTATQSHFFTRLILKEVPPWDRLLEYLQIRDNPESESKSETNGRR